MKISLGSDHGGFVLKQTIKKHLEDLGHTVLDEGTNSKDSVDYPIFAKKAADDVASGKADLGILVCTTGEGICIAANKVKGIRCGIGYSDNVSVKLREHNDANMIAFGQAEMSADDVIKRVDLFITTKFAGDRHQRRVDEIKELEK